MSDWKQMEGKRCPLFGKQKHTMLVIEGPSQSDHFSVQFGFDHGRFVTPWLHIIGNKRVKNPFIHVELVKTGTALTGVHAKVLDYNEKNHHVSGHVGIHHRHSHMSKIYSDFHDPNVWPKRIFVKYTWKTKHESDVEFAILTLLSITVLGMIAVGVRSMASYRKHIRQFFMETVMEEPKARVAPRYVQQHIPAPHVKQVWTPPPAQGPKVD